MAGRHCDWVGLATIEPPIMRSSAIGTLVGWRYERAICGGIFMFELQNPYPAFGLMKPGGLGRISCGGVAWNVESAIIHIML